ncbi:MAG: hypothetical protein Q8L84_05810 [Hyphomonas sp.]|nr:hypothetical protein [Hyphomonas sp.]
MSNKKDDNVNKDSTDKRGILPTENSPADMKSGVSSKLQTVKSAWEKAPDGAKKANAMKHYQSAEKAHKSGNEAEAMRELEEATRALN